MLDLNMHGFSDFLTKKGKKDNVVIDLVYRIREFNAYVNEFFNVTIQNALPDHIVSFLNFQIETQELPDDYIKAIALFYQFTGNTELFEICQDIKANLSNQKVRKATFRDIYGLTPEHAAAFRKVNIKSNEELLVVSRTHEDRFNLARMLNVPYNTILEYTKLADLLRVGGIRIMRAKLYHDAGFDTIQKIAAETPENFCSKVKAFINENNYNARPPVLREAAKTIRAAKIITPMLR